MASIFDQYDMKHTESKANFLSNNDGPKSGYITIRSEEEIPIFTKQKMKLNLPNDISHITVSNNWLICLMSHQVLLRLFLKRPDNQDEVFLDKYLGGYSVSKLFVDPSGCHLFMSLIPKSTGMFPDILYLHSKSGKPKRIEKFKEHEITAIGFNHISGNENSTGPILLGTSKGLIFEAEFGNEGDKVYYRKQVFDLSREGQCPITGIDFFRVPDTNQYIIVVATPDRLYKFQDFIKADEKFSLQTIFNSYIGCELVSGEIKSDLRYSLLRYSLDTNTKYPVRFAWLTGGGIVWSDFDQNMEFVSVCQGNNIIPLPIDTKISLDTASYTSTKKQPAPKAFILTEFHVLLLYSDHVTAICLLNQDVVYEEYFSEQLGKLLDVVKDPITSAVYIYTSKAFFRYRITNEQRNVWQLYLNKEEYDLAERYAKDNPANLDIVLGRKAEMYFNRKDYLESAKIYSNTQLTFEKICLKFLDLSDKKPLMVFLENRLDRLADEDQTQITMLVLWLIELFLTEIARASNNEPNARLWQKNFDDFLAIGRVSKCVRANRTVVYDLMGAHGDSHNLSLLATFNKDYESVINQHINQRKYIEALETLKLQYNPELYYKYCPILMEEIPHETINALKSHENRLNPEKLIPTLICLHGEEHTSEVIRYLEYAVYSLATTKVSLHNYLLKLYAQHQPDKLQMYLENQGHDVSLVHYDVKYALRVCQEHEAKTACVFIQCLLEMWDPAVELALTFSTQLAKETASQPSDKDLRRKLWLRIAQHEIKGTNDVKKALELLKECNLLRIEDLLPYFSDFEKIDDFKEVICDALKEYNIKIQELQKDMEESSKAADRVRNDLQTLGNRSIRISAQAKCGICEICILNKPFFVFPCGHKFHGDCLEKQIIPLLSSEKHRKLTSLKQQLEVMLTQTSAAMSNRNSMIQTIATREKIKSELENILSSDCLYCGIMIESLDQPFIDDWEKVNVDWE